MNNKAEINYPLVTKDSKGNVVHTKNSDGYETWIEYDKNNNRIHYKDSDGYENWREYDENNNLIHRKDSNGFEVWFDSEGISIPNPNLVTEVTLEDIAEKFGVSVKSLKIKK
jgi:YD repeat-containing protein